MAETEKAKLCPYCGKEMEAGEIAAAQYVVQWEKTYETPTFEEPKRVMLSSGSILNPVTAKAYYCKECQKVIVDVPDWESPLDKLDKKWSAWAEKRKAQREARQAQREEEIKEKQREKRRKNDPWED